MFFSSIKEKCRLISNKTFSKLRFSKFKKFVSRLVLAPTLADIIESEAVAQRCSVKKVLLKISPNSQETPVQNLFFQKETLAQLFSYEFCEISKTTVS